MLAHLTDPKLNTQQTLKLIQALRKPTHTDKWQIGKNMDLYLIFPYF